MWGPIEASRYTARRWPGRWRDLSWFALLAITCLSGARLAAPLYAIDGVSMTPTLRDGERLRVSRPVSAQLDVAAWWRNLTTDDAPAPAALQPFAQPGRGDIVVFTPPVPATAPFVKRVIGLSGETITFAGGRVLVNGQPLDEPYLAAAETYCRGLDYCQAEVPVGSIFVLGDNRTQSADSRLFGPVSLEAVLGEAWLGAGTPACGSSGQAQPLMTCP